jgi:hypothetical protein
LIDLRILLSAFIEENYKADIEKVYYIKVSNLPEKVADFQKSSSLSGLEK